MNLKNPYHELAELLSQTEGEFIQHLHYFMYDFKLDPERCDDYNGYLIPTTEDCQDIQEGLVEMIKRRAESIDKIIIK